MRDPEVAHSFLLGEVEALAPFDFVAVAPAGQPLHVAEVTLTEEGGLEVRVPGRPALVPPLAPKVRASLRERGFASEDAADPMKPWVQPAKDATEAVGLLRTVRIDVFGEKPDTPLDVAHGSHALEHEGRQKLARARSRIESIVADLLEMHAEQDEDGDYLLPIGQVHVTVAPRVTPDGHLVVRIFAITNVGVNVTAELGLFLARLNFGMMFGRFALDTEHRSIWFDETLLGEEFREKELDFVIRMIASTADSWDDRIKQMFGGATYQEVLAGRAAASPPPIKPGEGAGLYL